MNLDDQLKCTNRMFTAIAQLQSEMDVLMRATATNKSPVLSELKTMKLHLSHMHEKVEDIVSICVDEEDKTRGYRLNSEHFLQQQLIKDAEKLPYTQVYAQDWEVGLAGRETSYSSALDLKIILWLRQSISQRTLGPRLEQVETRDETRHMSKRYVMEQHSRGYIQRLM